MIKCKSSEIAFLKARIAELEALREKETNFMERNAFDLIIANYRTDLEILLFVSEVENENLSN